MSEVDIFLSADVEKLTKKKKIVFLGDSNVRAQYKDFLCLLRQNKLISDRTLRTKMESCVFGDKLKRHGEQRNWREYTEEREFVRENISVSFFFMTQVYNSYIEKVLRTIAPSRKKGPDVLIINSCLWDITRWGVDGIPTYQDNLVRLMKRLRILVPEALVIWLTTPPISKEAKGGFLVQELQFLAYSMRFHIVEANHFASQVVIDHGFDVVDSHYHLKSQIHRRAADGVHWTAPAVRYVTNLLLTHISLAWDVPLPGRSATYEAASPDREEPSTSASHAASSAAEANVDVKDEVNTVGPASGEAASLEGAGASTSAQRAPSAGNAKSGRGKVNPARPAHKKSKKKNVKKKITWP